MADPVEIAEAEEEGIIIHNHFAPKRIVGANGRATGVETLDVSRAFDERGRFNPQLTPNSEKIWECDSVIVSIGQTGELDWVHPEDGVEVYAARDTGDQPRNADDHRAGRFCRGRHRLRPAPDRQCRRRRSAGGARDSQLSQNVQPRTVRKGFFTHISKREYPDLGPLRNYLRWPRRQPPTIPVERRIGVAKVEERYSEADCPRTGWALPDLHH